MKSTYYKISAILEPGWILPYAPSIKVEGDIMRGGSNRRPVNKNEWPDPPHVAIANLGYVTGQVNRFASESEMRGFILRYGIPEDLNSYPSATNDVMPFEMRVSIFRWHQQQIRLAWEKRDVRLFTDPGNFTEFLGFEYLAVNWVAHRDGLILQPADCFTFAGLLLARDLAEERALICKNPNCPAPYFVANRLGAKYCSHRCAVSVNVRNFRNRSRRRGKVRRRKR